MTSVLARADSFCQRFGLRIPVVLGPMAGASPTSLSAAVANAGGMGACGGLLMQPAEIVSWATELRSMTSGPFQINLWIPDPPPHRDAVQEAAVRAFLSHWGPEVPAAAGDRTPPEFSLQCDAVLQAAPAAISSIMGLYPPDFVARIKARGIAWWATATTVAEARAAAHAGADVIVAQGMEAGGHRGAFDSSRATTDLIGLCALVPAVVDAVDLPVIAAGGIADSRTLAAALQLGASAVQIGTGFLRSPEAGIPRVWADALGRTAPEDTVLSRAFSGRSGRSIANAYTRAATSPDAPVPAPYPVQRGLTQAMRDAANSAADIGRVQAWAGQSAMLASPEPAAIVAQTMWDAARAQLR